MNDQGKTLIELLVAISIAVLMSAGAIPSFQRLKQKQQLVAATNTLYAAALFARQQAAYFNETVSIRNMGDSWETGAIIFTDHNHNGKHDPDEEVLRKIPRLKGVSASGNRHVQHYLSYRSDGSAHLKSNAFQVGTLTLCPITGGEGRKLILSIGGRLRRETAASTDCQPRAD
ncbi:GspH/FimT family pseudopilin [Spongiibacter marinus]|jgi:type IV fimbrial biogenesis protein FimT|uniref:GspH/FimT family pseudopilin n=1 Tax=Spongiibacter marinus TaxID=354246 RepID=UPI000423D2EF|nr:GspH/FimT family pseudopilin [Spongiibacter marinus]